MLAKTKRALNDLSRRAVSAVADVSWVASAKKPEGPMLLWLLMTVPNITTVTIAKSLARTWNEAIILMISSVELTVQPNLFHSGHTLISQHLHFNLLYCIFGVENIINCFLHIYHSGCSMPPPTLPSLPIIKSCCACLSESSRSAVSLRSCSASTKQPASWMLFQLKGQREGGWTKGELQSERGVGGGGR